MALLVTLPRITELDGAKALAAFTVPTSEYPRISKPIFSDKSVSTAFPPFTVGGRTCLKVHPRIGSVASPTHTILPALSPISSIKLDVLRSTFAEAFDEVLGE
jgi:hypothetical protein